MDGAVVKIPGDDAATGAFFIHDEIDGEILDEELRVIFQALLIKRVQDGVPGAIGGGAGALYRRFAIVAHVPTEWPLIDLAVLGARERHAEMLELEHRRDRLTAHVFDRVLIAEPVGALDGVVHMPLPVILGHVAQRRADTALRRDGVTAGRKHLGDGRGLQTRGGKSHGRPQARAASAHDDDVIGVVGDRIGGGHRCAPNATRTTASTQEAASPASTNLKNSKVMTRAPSPCT